MKTTLTVKFTSKIQAQQFTPVEHGDELTVEFDYENEEDLITKIEKWEKFIQTRVIKATFNGANALLEAKKALESD